MKFIYMRLKIILYYTCCCLLQRSRICSLIYCKIIELNINQGIYVYVSWYHEQLLPQCIKQWMNQFSKTQRSVNRVVTMNCDETPPPRTITLFYSSNSIVSCGYFPFSWVCWRCRRIRRICFLSGWGRLILFYWQNDKKNITNA